MDQARKLRPNADDDLPSLSRLKPTLPSGIEGLEKVLRFTTPGREGEPESGRERGVFTSREITHAIDLVHEAAQSIRTAEERVRDGEARTQALLERATEELKSAEGRVQAADARARAAESRAQEAETRAREAENWLRQIFSAISEELPQKR